MGKNLRTRVIRESEMGIIQRILHKASAFEISHHDVILDCER